MERVFGSTDLFLVMVEDHNDDPEDTTEAINGQADAINTWTGPTPKNIEEPLVRSIIGQPADALAAQEELALSAGFFCSMKKITQFTKNFTPSASPPTSKTQVQRSVAYQDRDPLALWDRYYSEVWDGPDNPDSPIQSKDGYLHHRDGRHIILLRRAAIAKTHFFVLKWSPP